MNAIAVGIMPLEKTGRGGKACENCNKRKIRCKSQSSGKCEACIQNDVQCIPRTRKKRRAIRTQKPHCQINEDSDIERHTRSHQDISQPGGLIRGILLETSERELPDVPIVPQSNSLGGRYWYDDTLSRLVSDNIPQVSPPDNGQDATEREPANLIAHDDEVEEASPNLRVEGTFDIDHQILQLRSSFALPPRPIRDSLNDAFMERCYPWTPIIERSWLEEGSRKPVSLLLVQAVFLAASRVSSSPIVAAYATPREFYQRAKALFWTGHERDALMTIRAACILNWFNPHGPEQVSGDTSRFWNHIAVGLAHQINLHKEPPSGEANAMRRRLWWSLVVRDSLLSASHGRPRAINLDDCDVRPPCDEDFPNSPLEAQLFIRYVEVCSMLGDITECYSRKHISRHHRQRIQNSISVWTKQLPENFQLFQKSPTSTDLHITRYNFNARQLHVPYFVILTVMHKTMTPNVGPSAVSVIAASYIAGIFEDFLARDEVQFLPAIFTFYGLAAAVSLISFRRYPHLQGLADQDLAVIMTVELELGKRWPTARGMRTALESMISSTPDARSNSTRSRLEIPNEDVEAYFSAYGTGLCRMRDAILNPGHSIDLRSNIDNRLPGNSQFEFTNTNSALDAAGMSAEPNQSERPTPAVGFEESWEDGMFDFQNDDLGLWLFDNRRADFQPQ